MNIKELAKKLNLSVTTTSRALNGHDTVSKKTIERVQRAADYYGYAPSQMARSLKSGRTNVIGLVFPVYASNLTPSFLSEFIVNLAAELDDMDYSLQVSVAQGGVSNARAWQKMVVNKQVDAMILPRLEENDSRISWLQERNFPFVAFGHPLEGADYPWLDLDNQQAYYDAVYHLYKRGHKDIALLSGNKKYLLSKQRIAGYSRAVTELNLPQKHYHISHHPMNEEGGAAGFNMLFAQEKPPTAIICANDTQAAGVMHVAQQRGLEIGRDIGVMGYDDLAWGAYHRPALTTFHQPTRSIAKRLAQMVVAHLNGEDIQDLQELWKARLVIRESCKIQC